MVTKRFRWSEVEKPGKFHKRASMASVVVTILGPVVLLASGVRMASVEYATRSNTMFSNPFVTTWSASSPSRSKSTVTRN